MRHAAGALALCLLLAGCRSIPAPSPLAADDPRPAAWLTALHETREGRRGLRARARLRLAGQHGVRFARELVLLERPARMRVEVLGLMGQRVAILATDGARYDLYRAETGRVESGVIEPTLLWEVVGIPVTPEEAVALLLGVPVLGPPELPALGTSDGGIELGWSLERVARRAGFDADGRLRFLEVAPLDGGEVILRAQWDAYERTRGEPFAHEVRLDFPAAGRSVEVRFEDVELDPELPPGIFRLDPAGRLSSAPGGGP